jgi:hypothetical protein
MEHNPKLLDKIISLICVNKDYLYLWVDYLIVLTILTSCSSSLSSIYDFDFPTTAVVVKSVSSTLQVSIPQGWFAAEDNECNCTEIWLVKDDYSGSIKFTTINVDSLVAEKITSDPMKLLEYSKLFIKVKLGSVFDRFENEELFRNAGITFFAYEYMDREKHTVRTVVFKYENKFFESAAYPFKPEIRQDVFKAQNSILASIQ